MRRNLFTASVLAASVTLLTWTPAAYAQPPTSTPPQEARQVSDTRPATTTVAGDTGLWFVPTAEVL
ncbi:MAG: hypothetical protein NUW22_11480, partial [Acidobacteria bacterium]|nr:hypothetical protein [Acidobacteriota bacterium]